MKYYRFLNADFGMLALQTKKWKLGRVSELNDPMDCFPLVLESDILPFEKNSDEVKARLEAFYQMTGLICYITAVNNPVMWSHYADMHRGIALEFDWPENHPKLKRVSYSRDDIPYRITRTDFDVSWSNRESARAFLHSALTLKAGGWSYEEEYREFVPLMGCDMVGCNYFTDIPLERMTGIYLGWKCTINEFDIIKLIHKNHKKPMDVIGFRMTFDGKTFSLGRKVLAMRQMPVS